MNSAMAQLVARRLSKTGERKSIVGLLARDNPVRRDVRVMVSGWDITKGIASPGYIRDQVNQLGIDATSLQLWFAKQIEYMISNGIPHDSIADYQSVGIDPLCNEIIRFVSDSQGWTDNLMGNKLNTVNDYQRRLQSAYDEAVASGYRLDGVVRPDVTSFGDPGITGPISEMWDFLKKVVYVGIGIVAVILFFSLAYGGFHMGGAKVGLAAAGG